MKKSSKQHHSGSTRRGRSQHLKEDIEVVWQEFNAPTDEKAVIGCKQDGAVLFRVLVEFHGCHWIDIYSKDEEEAREWVKRM